MRLKIPPVMVLLVAASAMCAISRATPAAAIPVPARRAIALAVAALGIGIIAAGVIAFWRAKTTVNPLHPERASRLVVDGIYRTTRNPMYLGMLLVLTGWAGYLANIAALVVLPVFVGCMNHFQIRPEERVLESRFGSEFAAYRRRVRRWI